jgi:CheY-like chemotaxis protein
MGATEKTIVIVEDDEMIAALMQEALNDEPEYQAAAVHNGCQAPAFIKALHPSLVLLDLNLPGLDGVQVYDRMQQDPTTRDIPVLFVTANHRDPRLRERGFTNILAKPFHLDTLLTRVAAAIYN